MNSASIPGTNQIEVVGYKDGKKYTDACEWSLNAKEANE
jgi:hypothetical protein